MAKTVIYSVPGRVDNVYEDTVATSDHVYDNDLKDSQENINKRVQDRLDELVWIED